MSARLEYRIVTDAGYLVDCVQRYRESRPGYRRQRVLTWLVTPFLLAFLAWMIFGAVSGQRWLGIAMYALLLAVIWLKSPFERHWLRRRAGPVREAHLVLDETGIQAEGGESSVEIGWSMLTKARVFGDGVLIHDHERNLRWLPHAALVSGTPAEVEALLRAKLSDVACSPGRKRRS